jgi:type I restriction enzyme S subunit
MAARRLPFRALVEFAIGGGWGVEDPLEDHDTLVAIVRGTDFAMASGGHVNTLPRRYETARKVAKRALREGDLLLEISGGNPRTGQATGRSMLVTQRLLAAAGTPVIPASFCRLVRIDEEIVDPRFALALLTDMYLSGRARSYENQSTGLSNFQFERFLDEETVRLPPVAEQRAIASVLEALDGKIESNLRLADATTLTWIEPANRALRFGDVEEVPVSRLIADGTLNVNDGYRAKNAELDKSGIPFLRAGNLTANGIDLAGADLVPPEVVARAGRKVSALWDTAFTSKGTVGRITLIEPSIEPYVYSPQICYWRSTNLSKLSPFVLHAWMRGTQFTSQVNAVKGQTDMADYVSLRDQRAMTVNLPGPDQQAEVDRLADPMARFAATLRREAKALGFIRDALLPKLVSGTIRVPLTSDPEEQLGATVEALGA